MTQAVSSAAKAPATANNGAGDGPAVYSAIAAVMGEIAREGIAKSNRNQQQGYNFRGIDDVYNALSSVLARNGLLILPRVLSRETVERTTAKGSPLFFVTVEMEFTLVAASDGSAHVIKTYGEAMDSADKATNKAMSAAFKYAAMQTFCIPTEGDNDADATTHEIAPRGPSAAAQFAADQLRAAKTKDEFAHFWNGQRAGLRETLGEADYAHVVGVMQAEAGRFADKPAENDTFPGDMKDAA